MDIDECMEFLLQLLFWKTVNSEDKEQNDDRLTTKAIQCIDYIFGLK